MTEPVAITVDADTARLVRLAARVAGLTEGQVVANLLALAQGPESAPEPPPADPWAPVAIHATYEGATTRASYVPATGRVQITSGPLTGREFRTPSGAARAVVAMLNPHRAATQTNGWRFWKISETGVPLRSLR